MSDIVNGTNLEDDSTVTPGASWPVFGSGTSSSFGTTPGFSRVLVVQFAWGSGASGHVVTLTVSLFGNSGGGEVIVQGLAQ